MAVTVLTEPATYCPAYNPQWFTASSTQTAQPNFKYYVTFTDVTSGTTIAELYSARPSDGRVWVNAGTFAENFITQVVPDSLYDFQTNTGALRQITVNIGEQYDVAGVSTNFTGSNKSYYVWNGVLDFLDFPSYVYTDYIYDRGVSNVKFITDNVNPNWTYGNLLITQQNPENTYYNRSNYLYCINKNANQFEQLEIKGYDGSGNLLSTSYINNTITASANRYTFIDIGYKGLANIPVTNVTGTWPIPVSTFSYYEIRDISTVVGAGSQTVFIKRINVICEPRFDVISLYYLSKAGSFEVLHFTKLSERTSNITSEGYSQYPYTAISGVIKYDESVSVDRTLSVAERKRIKVNSDWVTTEEIKRYKDIATSPLVYIDQADGYGFVSVKVLPQTYKEQKKYNEKLTSLSFDLEFTHQNWRQRG